MTKIDDRYWIETDYLYNLHIQANLKQILVLKVQNIHMFMLLIHNIPTTQVFHVLKYTQKLKHSVVNRIHFILHNIQIFLFYTLMVLICTQDNLTLTP